MPDGALQRLLSRLSSLRSYHTRYQVILGLLLCSGLVLSGLLLASLLSSVWVVPAEVRVASLGIFGLILSVSLAYFVFRPLIYRPSFEQLALRVEERFPQLSDRLISALQLQKQFVSNPEGYSLEMIDAVVYQADQLSENLDFKSVVDKRNLRKYGRTTGILAVILAAFALIFPGNFKFALQAFSNPLTEMESPAKFTFELFPGNKEVVKYSDVEIGVKLSPTPEFQNLELPRKIKLFYKFENSEWESVNLKRIDQTKLTLPEKMVRLTLTTKNYDFAHTFKEVKRNFQFYALAEGEKSETYRITVVDKPRVVDLKITLNFPSYTGLKAQVLNDNEGNIKALVGTKTKIQVRANKVLEAASLIFSDGNKLALNINGKVGSSEIKIAKNLTYHIEVIDENDNSNPDPIEYEITAVPDELPQVEIAYPGEDRDLDETMRMRLRIAVRDDFGISALKLKYKINSGGHEWPEEETVVSFPKEGSEFSTDYDWSLAKFPIVPGDYISYYAEVWDNDAVSGPKWAKSRTYTLRLPTLDEIIAEVEQEQSGQITQLQEVFWGTEELKRKLDKLSLDMEQGQNQSWEKSKEFESALQQQEEIFQKVDQIKSQLEETINKMLRNQVVRQEVAQKMQEIRELMEQVTTPEMKELLKKLQEALKNLDWEKIKESLKDFKLSQEDLLKRLDQTIAMLKRLQAEQKLDAMTKMLEQMAQKQDEINQKLAEMAEKGISQLSEQEKGLQKDLENVAEQFDEFRQQMMEMPLLSAEDLFNMEVTLNRSGNQKDISSMSQQLGMCQKKNASNTGEKLASSFQKAAQQFRQMAEKLSRDQEKEILAQMQKTLQDVLYLSEEQEKLSDQVKQNQRDSDHLRDLAGQQMSLKESTEKLNQDLEELLKQSSSIPQKLSQKLGMCSNQMSQAASELTDRDGANALSLQTEAMANLNEIARDLLDAVNKSCNNPGSGMCSNPSLSQSLQNLAQQQQGINQSTEDYSNLLQDMMFPGQGELQRLAQEQAGVQKSLEELFQEQAESANILGRLDKLAAEIKEAVKKLEKGELDEELKRRQNRILNRLLDAEKSLYTQDFSNQRKAETGEDVLRRSPSALNLNQDSGALSEQEKLMLEKYPAQYEEMIKSYFRAIRSGDNK